MALARRKRPTLTPTVEGMESREVLNAAVPAQLAAEIHALRASFIPVIKGTIQGTVTRITPVSTSSEIVAYAGKGKANVIGDGRGTGQHTITSTPLRNGATRDTYRNGFGTVKGTTDQVAFQYTGSGRTNANGSFTATLHGTARSVAGLHAGLSGPFTAHLSGNTRTGAFTITFTIRV